MRVCYAKSPIKTPGIWRLWRANHWHVYRTTDADAPVPAGASEISRGEELPVSEAELRRVTTSEAPFGEPIEAEYAADVVRGLRHDPGTHDWHAWVSPVHLAADEAADAYADAMTRPKTLHSHIVLRPCHSSPGWFAWIGLGSLIDAILKPDLSARWKSRDQALAAAYSAIAEARRECWAEIEHLLCDWDIEAINHIREGRVPVAFGVVRWSQVILVHEGDSAGASSWDLPIVERLNGAAAIAIRQVKARRESECDRAERKAALRQRKNERNRRNKGTIASWLRRAGYVRNDGEVDIPKAAEALGIDQKNLRQYLAGEISPSVETLNRIAKAIGWEVRLSFEPGK
jgi:hypothetical protein